VPPPPRYVLDANVYSRIRRMGCTVREFVGDVDAGPTLIVVDELLYALKHNHERLYEVNVRLLAETGTPIPNRPSIVFAAKDLQRTYARHHAPPDERDALIAAAAIEEDRILITENVDHFRFIEWLWHIDAVGHDPARDGPLTTCRKAVQGAIDRGGGCCAAIRADRAKVR
jgi:predicted nucleic acid-binding protein